MEENNTPVQETAVETTSEAPQAEATTTSKSPRMGLRVDERTGRRVVETIDHDEPMVKTNEEPIEKAQEEVPQEQQAPQPVQPQVPPTPQYYSPAEMSLALQLGQVDESKIPPQYQPQYLALKQKNAPPPPPQKSEEELRTEFLDAVNAAAKEKAMKDLNLTEDELALGEFSDDEEVQAKVARYKAAVDIARNQIVSGYGEQVRIEQAKMQQEQAFRKGVSDWIDEQRQSEPHFDEIGFFMQEHYKSMPYEKAATIAPAVQSAMKGQLDPQSAEIVKAYYDDCRKEFYAKKNGTSTTPVARSPSVERRGGGQDVVKPVDYAEQLRTAPVRDRAKIVEAWLGSMQKR